jgi:hypothetical protein
MRRLCNHAAAQATMIDRPNDKSWVVNAAAAVAVHAPDELRVFVARQSKIETVNGKERTRRNE